jgi:phenylalanyl-tRNA synthetase beta chain
MRISCRWLARHVDLAGITPAQLAEDLTLSTAEVEGLEPFAPELAAVTVGHVLERERHPNADRLSVCRVDVGRGEPLQIVCGAPNVRAGQRVAVATVGTLLAGERRIEKAKIRGVESRGMICSERELGLGEEHDGIWVLSPEAEVGLPVAQALGLEDWVLEIDNKSLTHRPDLWGHRGIAREVAAIYRRELRPLDTRLPAPRGGDPFPVRVESPACSRYVALALGGVRGGRSPDWLRHLLLAAGQRPLELLVDLSNFVMLDLGQPNHLFDRARLAAEGIVVRQARAGERLTTLDGKERALDPGDLLICSGERPVALAGIIGGEETKVAAESGELVLEVACFDPVAVRRTSARLGIRTEASARFEKSLDPGLPPVAAAHLARILFELDPGAYLAAPPTDVGAWRDPARTIALRPEHVRALLGDAVEDASQVEILRRLGFGVERRGGELLVRVPSERATRDVTIEQDLVEEIGRIWRYGNVPERPLVAPLVPPPRDERRELVRRIEDRLAGGARMRQTISYSFAADDLLAALRMLDQAHVEVVNPVAQGLSKVRRSVVPSLLAALAGARRERERVRLFELGKGYLPTAQAGVEPTELHELALVWADPQVPAGAFDRNAWSELKGVVVDLLESLALALPAWRRPAAEDLPPWAHPRRAACLDLGGSADAALVCALEPGVARALGLAGELASDAAVARISIDALLAALPSGPRSYHPLPRFPGIKLDVALALPLAVQADEARAAIAKAAKGLAAPGNVELFDVYAGAELSGRRSLAWHVVLQSPDRTLAPEDQQQFLARLERLAADLGGELRRE